MSAFNPGGGTLKSTTKAAAFAESARLLTVAENIRNAANTGIPPRNNVTVTADLDTGTFNVTASLPVVTGLSATGQLEVTASDYLGSPYTDFLPGVGGDLKSTNLVAAFFETAQILSAAEKVIQPAENQPNNIQVAIDLEGGTINITSAIPITFVGDAQGHTVITTSDYV